MTTALDQSQLEAAVAARGGRIVWLLEELGLEYEINKMAFHPKDLKSDAHRDRHPLGRPRPFPGPGPAGSEA